MDAYEFCAEIHSLDDVSELSYYAVNWTWLV